MIPILAVQNVDAACDQLVEVFGFARIEAGLLAFGDQQVFVAKAGALPEGSVAQGLDHLALRVPDVDGLQARVTRAGGVVSQQFTPDGPREIAAFWGGVRFVFFDGPEGWPIEFCMRRDGSITEQGHDHYGIRCVDVAQTAADLAQKFAPTQVAAVHLLAGTPPVDVRFLAAGAQMFELFDEPQVRAPQAGAGWVGFLPVETARA
ncbi:Glyoxalase-like domain protein [Aquimixticola soesokkakensis]|uniref:Glyoxalase-like domain protein n=1 Tax=Aquimixticola soesokkakensis TaxID=1519096 RepID=A0A1Y5RSF3_9RHOB|nr:VOC family protein [Aquimixticola soesokkakensis]SLN23276.1 Glyoxalase-like domain protein [Aquimixticola soesokkakensis]